MNGETLRRLATFTFAADRTRVRLDPLVLVDMLQQLLLLRERFGALGALVRSVVFVRLLVPLQMARLLEHFAAYEAVQRSIFDPVLSHVRRQRVTRFERHGTLGAVELVVFYLDVLLFDLDLGGLQQRLTVDDGRLMSDHVTQEQRLPLEALLADGALVRFDLGVVHLNVAIQLGRPVEDPVADVAGVRLVAFLSVTLHVPDQLARFGKYFSAIFAFVLAADAPQRPFLLFRLQRLAVRPSEVVVLVVLVVFFVIVVVKVDVVASELFGFLFDESLRLERVVVEELTQVLVGLFASLFKLVSHCEAGDAGIAHLFGKPFAVPDLKRNVIR